MNDEDLQVSEAGRQGTAAAVAVVGELNFHTSGELPTRVMDVAGAGHTDVVLDLSGVPFCDSSGLNALIVLYHRLRGGGGSLVLAAVPQRLRRLLSMTGVDTLISIRPTVQDALAAQSGD